MTGSITKTTSNRLAGKEDNQTSLWWGIGATEDHGLVGWTSDRWRLGIRLLRYRQQGDGNNSKHQ